jgi:hypothetical protein
MVTSHAPTTKHHLSHAHGQQPLSRTPTRLAHPYNTAEHTPLHVAEGHDASGLRHTTQLQSGCIAGKATTCHHRVRHHARALSGNLQRLWPPLRGAMISTTPWTTWPPLQGAKTCQKSLSTTVSAHEAAAALLCSKIRQLHCHNTQHDQASSLSQARMQANRYMVYIYPPS